MRSIPSGVPVSVFLLLLLMYRSWTGASQQNTTHHNAVERYTLDNLQTKPLQFILSMCDTTDPRTKAQSVERNSLSKMPSSDRGMCTYVTYVKHSYATVQTIRRAILCHVFQRETMPTRRVFIPPSQTTVQYKPLVLNCIQQGCTTFVPCGMYLNTVRTYYVCRKMN